MFRLVVNGNLTHLVLAILVGRQVLLEGDVASVEEGTVPALVFRQSSDISESHNAVFCHHHCLRRRNPKNDSFAHLGLELTYARQSPRLLNQDLLDEDGHGRSRPMAAHLLPFGVTRTRSNSRPARHAHQMSTECREPTATLVTNSRWSLSVRNWPYHVRIAFSTAPLPLDSLIGTSGGTVADCLLAAISVRSLSSSGA